MGSDETEKVAQLQFSESRKKTEPKGSEMTFAPQGRNSTSKHNVIKLTIIGKNTGVCSRDSGILVFNLGLERHDKQTDQKSCLYRY